MFTKEGLYHSGIELNEYPYLDHEEKKEYDLIQVGHVMSTPPQCLGLRERASTIVEILEGSCHNGFPVVDKKSSDLHGGKFLGLVRRDQLVALLECRVFMESHSEGDVEANDPNNLSLDGSLDEDNELSLSSHFCWTSTPNRGVHNSPLMNLAYHIKDDRYEEFLERSFRGRNELVQVQSNLQEPPMVKLGNKWTGYVRQSVKNLDSESLPAKVYGYVKRGASQRSSLESSTRTFPVPVTDSVPAPFPLPSRLPVHMNSTGQISARIHPSDSPKWINIAAVMNRGAKTVTEFCPLSTAKLMFEQLGLRHLVVLGGDTGGSVVGVVTRANLLPSHIESLFEIPASPTPDVTMNLSP